MDFLPAALLLIIAKAAGASIILWKGVSTTATEVGWNIPKWANVMGPRVLSLMVYLYLALMAAQFAGADVALGALASLFLANLGYDAIKGVTTKPVSKEELVNAVVAKLNK